MLPAANPFLTDPIGKVLLRTALPIVFLTSVNGLLTVVDAMLLGAFVGPQALGAVTLLFPFSMLMVALSTMIASGMASVVARRLGAGNLAEAQKSFAGAHGLALLVSLGLAAALLLGGPGLIAAITPDPTLAAMGRQFLTIMVLTAPVMFIVAIHSDALRVEGRVGFMALAGLIVSLGNIACNVVFIAGFKGGVAGSAWGTAVAQALALLLILLYRRAGKSRLRTPRLSRDWWSDWRAMLALGAPRSLSFLGIALGSAATIAAIRLHAGTGQDELIAAYGAVTRIMTFAYLPLLGLSLAMQAVAGNNFGAGKVARAQATLRLALLVSLVYCTAIELVLLTMQARVGGLFVADTAVVGQVRHVLPFYAAFYCTLGPMMMIASYLQSIGDAKRSALLSLARTYGFAIPLTFALPLMLGETGIWLALPMADLLLVIVTGAVVWQRRRGGRGVAAMG